MKSLRDILLGVACSTLALLCLSAKEHTGDSGQWLLMSDMRAKEVKQFLASSKASIKIDAMSINIVDAVGLDKIGFEAQKNRGVAMYRLQIPCPSTSTKLFEFINECSFRPHECRDWNIQYKVSFFDGEQELFHFYADSKGNILLGDTDYEPKKNWLPHFWDYLFKDIYNINKAKHINNGKQ